MDVARATACALVVLLHSGASYFYAFGPLWVPAVVFDALGRGAVPMFFMLSGALLLRKHEPIFSFYRRRVVRVLLPLTFWTAVYVFAFGDHSISLFDHFVHYLVTPYGHLWYFYAALGLYLSAPYLGMILRASSDREILVFLGLWFSVSCVLNQVRLLSVMSSDVPTLFGGQLFSGYLGFFVLGAYLQRESVLSWIGGWPSLWVFALSTTGVALATIAYSLRMGRPDQSFFVYQTPLVAVASIAGFVWLTSIRSLPRFPGAAVRVIADSSLGIYCLHPILLSFYQDRLHLGDSIHSTWLKIPVVWLVVFCTALALIHVARKVPPLKRVA
ncbi:acyltransferase [Luteibacter aegosomatissinici]|uniref:acyltransferase n=1 Tax=Luteibacter aegosomatissinici TaxID=2911539 RepID=UPI001FF98DF2|nr:acyltransferase family protein [Luteibacter aegosomatissinici]UPG95343.1 acyltransferase family protein [Luteibacter aegosomatissinici]